MIPPAAVLTDLEGTTTPIAFVRDHLFPYARRRMAAWCAANAGAPVLAEVARLAPGRAPEDALLGWMARDEKITPLKTIQGMIWAEGYASGEIKGALYPDVPPALRRWAQAGVKLYVYSSGSEEAQKLLFAHSEAGDLSGLFAGYFDTRVGPKRDFDSYAAIARGVGVSRRELLFLSDMEPELEAAETAGLRTCQLIRPDNGTIASTRHETAATFAEVAQKFGLPLHK